METYFHLREDASGGGSAVEIVSARSDGSESGYPKLADSSFSSFPIEIGLEELVMYQGINNNSQRRYIIHIVSIYVD